MNYDPDYGDFLISQSEAIWQDCECKSCGKKWRIDISGMDKDDMYEALEDGTFDECFDCRNKKNITKFLHQPKLTRFEEE